MVLNLKKEVYTNSSLTHTKTYTSHFVYTNNNLEYALFDEGRLINSRGFKYQYFLKDHLGNTRILFASNWGSIEVFRQYHYYPFGMSMLVPGTYVEGLDNKYRYNGKELQEDHDLNWYDYGA